MPIINKGGALITQVLTHLYVYVHFQVFPKPNVMFTLLLLFFSLFITKTTPICHQNVKTSHPAEMDGEMNVCLSVSVPCICSHDQSLTKFHAWTTLGECVLCYGL